MRFAKWGLQGVKMNILKYLVLLCLSLVCYGVEIRNPHTSATPPNAKNASVYMDIYNDTNTPITLVSISSKIASKAQIHRTQNHDGMIGMEHIDELTIEPLDSISLEAGGLHIMLMNITKPLLEGEFIDLELHFKDGTFIIIDDIPVLKQSR